MARKWTQAEIDFVRENSPKMMRKELWQKFCEQFEYRTFLAISGFCDKNKIKALHNGQFIKGMTAWNKGKRYSNPNNPTKFKKGDLPSGTLPVGAEKLKSGGYLYVKIAHPNKWRAKHHIEYERHFGKIPSGHIVRFIDGDNRNFDKENLIAIPKKANAFLNHHSMGFCQNKYNKTVILTAHLQSLLE